MSKIPQVLHRAAQPIASHEFYDALRATCPPRMPLARCTMHRPVAMAISGGVDSMALAFLCARARRQDPMVRVADHPVLSFHALIIDHRLRDGSHAEARAVSRALAAMGVRSQVIPLQWAAELAGRDDAAAAAAAGPAALPNLESAARRLRYRALGRRCALSRYVSLLFAHHEDDQYETVLMRLLAGHGPRGLRGIRAANDIPECRGIHGADRSGFVDDQRLKRPYFSFLPSRADKRFIKRALRNDIDPLTYGAELAAGRSSDLFDPFAFEDEYVLDERGKHRKAPFLAPLDIEDLGVMIYRPLLEFGKDRLIATCEANGITWFEDHTNQDPTLTTRNALRYMVREHKLPVALQKPAILQLARRCDGRARMEEAEARRLLDRTLIRNFQPSVGTVVVKLPELHVRPRRKGSMYSAGSATKRTEHQRVIAAVLIQKLLSLVTPEPQVTPATHLQPIVSKLFPSLSPDGPEATDPKAFTICGVFFTPVRRTTTTSSADPKTAPYWWWYLSREPHASPARPAARAPAQQQQAAFPALKFRHRWLRRPEHWSWPRWSPWRLYDGRFWVRLSHRLPFEVRAAPFGRAHAQRFREGLLDGAARGALAAQLRRYAPGKVRYTLPGLYTLDDIDWALLGKGGYWLKEDAAGAGAVAGADAEGPREGAAAPGAYRGEAGMVTAETAAEEEERVRQWRWEEERRAGEGDMRLLALPTLGVQLPGIEHWVRWEVRYRRVDRGLLEGNRSVGRWDRTLWMKRGEGRKTRRAERQGVKVVEHQGPVPHRKRR